MKILEILLAALTAFGLGFLWNAVIFKKLWVTTSASAGNTPLAKSVFKHVAAFVCLVVVAYFMDNGCLETHINGGNFGHGLFHGGLYAVSYAVPILGVSCLYQQKSIKGFLLEAGYAVLTFATIGGMLSLLTLFTYE